MKITIQQKVKAACDIAGITLAELSGKMGMSQQSMSNRLKTGKFTKEEYEKMAQIMGAKFTFQFEFPDGTKI